ncbi:hypothetical protein D9M68_894110 [compost metagenome]
MLLETDELGGADGREVGRVREQDQPLAFVVGERAVAVGGLGVEVWGGFVEAGEGGGVFHEGLHSVRFRKNRESRIACPMNEVYGCEFSNSLLFLKRAIGIAKRLDSWLFPSAQQRLGKGKLQAGAFAASVVITPPPRQTSPS